jgi:hypothetical protein
MRRRVASRHGDHLRPGARDRRACGAKAREARRSNRDPRCGYPLDHIAANAPDLIISETAAQFLDDRECPCELGDAVVISRSLWSGIQDRKVTHRTGSAGHARGVKAGSTTASQSSNLRAFFVDKTSGSTSTAREYRSAPKGDLPRACIPYGRRKETSFIAEPQLAGMIAPLVLGGTDNGVAFLAYVDRAPLCAIKAGRRRRDGHLQ